MLNKYPSYHYSDFNKYQDIRLLNRYNNIEYDLIKIEFKTHDSEFVDSKHYPNLIKNTLECLQAAIAANKTTYIKIVVSSKTKSSSFTELVDKIFKNISKGDISGFVIQPTTSISEPSLEKLMEFYDIVYTHYEEVRIVPQLQKIINAR